MSQLGYSSPIAISFFVNTRHRSSPPHPLPCQSALPAPAAWCWVYLPSRTSTATSVEKPLLPAAVCSMGSTWLQSVSNTASQKHSKTILQKRWTPKHCYATYLPQRSDPSEKALGQRLSVATWWCYAISLSCGYSDPLPKKTYSRSSCSKEG